MASTFQTIPGEKVAPLISLRDDDFGMAEAIYPAVG